MLLRILSLTLPLVILPGLCAKAQILYERPVLTQRNLGDALERLGERESGTARLKEAVATYREALQEFTREREPVQWARTQTHLGEALKNLQ